MKTVTIENIDASLLRQQILALTQVVFKNRPSEDEMELLAGLLNMIENVYDKMCPPNGVLVIP